MPGVVRRSRSLGDPAVLLGFGGRDKIDSGSLLAASVLPGGTDEVQTVTITGGPTGGGFILTYAGQSTPSQVFNVTSDALETALEALSSIGAGNVTVTGAAGGPYTVTFRRDLGRQDVGSMTAAHTFTGGTTPAIAVATSVPGSAVDSGRLIVKRGTILTVVPGNVSKLRRYTAQGGEAIAGVLGRTVEFFDQSSASDTDVPFYVGPGCVFNKPAIIDYATYQSAFDTFCAANGNRVGKQN